MLAMRPCQATTSGASHATFPSLTGKPTDAGSAKSTSTPPCCSHMATISLAMMYVVELSRLIAETTINRMSCPLSVRTALMVARDGGLPERPRLRSRRNGLEPVELTGEWTRCDHRRQLVGRRALHGSQGRGHLDAGPIGVVRDGPGHGQVDLGPQVGPTEILGFLQGPLQQLA